MNRPATLHSSQSQEIMELFTALNREGTTIVQVTHSEINAGYGTRTNSVEGWLAGWRHGESVRS